MAGPSTILRGAHMALQRAGLTPAPWWLDERSMPAGTVLSWWGEGGTYAVEIPESLPVGEAGAVSLLDGHLLRVRVWYRIRPGQETESILAAGDSEQAAWMQLLRRASWEGGVSIEPGRRQRTPVSGGEIRQVEMSLRVVEHVDLSSIAPGV